MNIRLSVLAVFLLWICAIPVKAADHISDNDTARLNEVSQFWAREVAAAKSRVAKEIVIIMIDDEDYRDGDHETLIKTLEIIGGGAPRAVLVDFSFPSAGNASMELQAVLNRLYPNVVWMGKEGGLARYGMSFGILPLGNPLVWPLDRDHRSENSFALIEPCDPTKKSAALPNAVFLLWEVANGLYRLPYHKDCALWGRSAERMSMRTFAEEGRYYVPVQYFGKDFFTKIATSALLAGDRSGKEFKDKIVLIGSNLPDKRGKRDQHLTAVGMIDGTEILAHALGTLLSAPK